MSAAIGARRKTARDSQRHMPRRERKKYAAAMATTAPASATASIAKLFSPAKTATMTTARAASAKLRRASQRCEGVAGVSGGPSIRELSMLHDRAPTAPAPHPHPVNMSPLKGDDAGPRWRAG